MFKKKTSANQKDLIKKIKRNAILFKLNFGNQYLSTGYLFNSTNKHPIRKKET